MCVYMYVGVSDMIFPSRRRSRVEAWRNGVENEQSGEREMEHVALAKSHQSISKSHQSTIGATSRLNFALFRT